ncbi:MAG: hypothetical protein Faunusvirus1_61 [Faunusvirus sp.]|uniref:Uncharacterized protein n=1 Tax=Faunusvirus sp. TaxID=2487766 RepID=A0A3G4ZYG0_9VIRU|nr:MAG: hypothetical protein Faunusvirus1_61 [Faunusvirus sp.]
MSVSQSVSLCACVECGKPNSAGTNSFTGKPFRHCGQDCATSRCGHASAVTAKNNRLAKTDSRPARTSRPPRHGDVKNVDMKDMKKDSEPMTALQLDKAVSNGSVRAIKNPLKYLKTLSDYAEKRGTDIRAGKKVGAPDPTILNMLKNPETETIAKMTSDYAKELRHEMKLVSSEKDSASVKTLPKCLCNGCDQKRTFGRNMRTGKNFVHCGIDCASGRCGHNAGGESVAESEESTEKVHVDTPHPVSEKSRNPSQCACPTCPNPRSSIKHPKFGTTFKHCSADCANKRCVHEM